MVFSKWGGRSSASGASNFSVDAATTSTIIESDSTGGDVSLTGHIVGGM